VCGVTDLSVHYESCSHFLSFLISPWVTPILEGVILGFFNVALSLNSQTNKMIKNVFKFVCFPQTCARKNCDGVNGRLRGESSVRRPGIEDPNRRQRKLSNTFFHQQGICHTYIYERGRTGGWQDMHCSHLFKVC
jgi:hypothetical protein